MGMDQFIAWVIKQRRTLLLVLIVSTVGLGYFAKNVALDNGLEVWFVKDDPTLKAYQAFKGLYGNDEIILIWIQPPEGQSVFDQEFVKNIYQFSAGIETHDMVKRVLSMSRAPHIYGTKGSLAVEQMVGSEPDSQSYQAKVLQKKLAENPLWFKLLFSKNRLSTVVIVEPELLEDMDGKRPELIQAVKNQLAQAGLKRAKLAGMGIVYEELNRISLRDSPLFTLVAYLLLIALLYIFFRSGQLVQIAAYTMIISATLFLGLYGLFDQKMNMISAVLPTLIVIICLADIVHLYAHYEHESAGSHPPNRALFNAVRLVALPCLFTSLTTAVGFIALVSSPMQVLKSFGLFSSAGVLIAYIVSMLIGIVVLGRNMAQQVSTPSNESATPKNSLSASIESLLLNVHHYNVHHYKLNLVMGVGLLILAVVGITRLQVDTYSINFLLDSNPVKKNSQSIEKEYGNYVPLELRIMPDKRGQAEPVKNIHFLSRLLLLQTEVDKLPGVEKSTSIVDAVRHLNRVLTDNSSDAYAISRDNNLLGQSLLLYEMDEDNDLAYSVDNSYSEVRLTMRIPMVSSKKMHNIMQDVEQILHQIFPPEEKVTWRFGGYIPLYVRMMDYITQSQVSSFLIAFLLIFTMMGFLLRSFKMVLFGIIPNVMPIFLTLGLMGILGIYLDIATVTIAAITIGISVDDTIHFLYTLQTNLKKGLPLIAAVEETTKIAGKAILVTSVMLVGGYLILVFASVKSVIYFGLLISVTMVFALICDLIFLPSVLFFSGKKQL